MARSRGLGDVYKRQAFWSLDQNSLRDLAAAISSTKKSCNIKVMC
jgi:hypothetical protein